MSGSSQFTICLTKRRPNVRLEIRLRAALPEIAVSYERSGGMDNADQG